MSTDAHDGEGSEDETLSLVVARPTVVTDPRKLLRVAWTALAVLDGTPPGVLDPDALGRVRALLSQLHRELAAAVTPEAAEEISRLSGAGIPSLATEDELRVLEAQLVGWLRGVMLGEEIATWGAAVEGVSRLATRLAERNHELPDEPVPRGPYL